MAETQPGSQATFDQRRQNVEEQTVQDMDHLPRPLRGRSGDELVDAVSGEADGGHVDAPGFLQLVADLGPMGTGVTGVERSIDDAIADCSDVADEDPLRNTSRRWPARRCRRR